MVLKLDPSMLGSLKPWMASNKFLNNLSSSSSPN